MFTKLYAVGVDYEDVLATLEREGIEKFVASADRRSDRFTRSAETSAAVSLRG